MLLCVAAAGMIFAIPAMADGNVLDGIVDDYKAASEAKLEWLENRMGPPATAKQQAQAYQQTTVWLTQKADDTLEDLLIAAGNDPILLAQIPELVQEIAEMEQEFLEEAEEIYNTYVPPVTTTLPPVTTTTVTLPPITVPPVTTTLPVIPSSTTSTTTTSTTSTTVAMVTTTTTRPQAVPVPVTVPPSSGASASGGPGIDGVIAEVANSVEVTESAAGSRVLSEAAAAVPRSPFLFNVEPSEVVAVQRMLAPYEPAALPSRLPAPVTSFLAIVQMVVGAFLSSFKQIGGPATAGGLYLVYEVVRHIRSKAPGVLPA